jgi:polysaccharide pyruvyl transferase CsaB
MSQSLRFLIYGMYGAVNVGDEFVGLAIADNVRAAFPNAMVCLATADPAKSSAFHEDNLIRYTRLRLFDHRFWLHLPPILRQLQQFDVIIVGGGGLFQDQYMWRLPAGSALMCALGASCGKPTYVVGTGVGPLRRKWVARAVGAIFPLIDGVYLRDKESLDTALHLGADENRTFLTADVVPGLSRFDSYRQALDIKSKTVSLILREWAGLNPLNVAMLADELVESGYDVRFHLYQDNDAPLIEKIKAGCSESTLEHLTSIIPRTAREAIEELAASKIVMSMRLHGCVLSAMLGVPWIPVVYESKVRGFAEQMSKSEWLLSTGDLRPGLLDRIEEAFKSHSANRDSELAAFQSVRERSLKNYTWTQNDFTVRARASSKNRGRREAFSLLARGFMAEIAHLAGMSWLKTRLAKT